MEPNEEEIIIPVIHIFRIRDNMPIYRMHEVINTIVKHAGIVYSRVRYH